MLAHALTVKHVDVKVSSARVGRATQSKKNWDTERDDCSTLRVPQPSWSVVERVLQVTKPPALLQSKQRRTHDTDTSRKIR